MDQAVPQLAATRSDMRQPPLYPSLYQINTRVWLTRISRDLGRAATLDDLPDAELDRIAAMGFDWVWLLSVWQTGAAGQRISRANAEWRREFEATLSDLTEDDIAGSGFAITGYTVHTSLGGDAALARLRERLRTRGLKLMLDFVPNHTGVDHPWVKAHPEYYVQGVEADRLREPQNYTRLGNGAADPVFAYGRDPYFAGWPDTLQLDYSRPETHEAMAGELVRISGQCDGVRCDMAMLVLPEVFERTWGRKAPHFWPDATRRVRAAHPAFVFMAEVYWDLEWAVMQQGFDYAYDKRLYDRLHEGRARPVREHLHAELDYQARLARFMENHDEPRAAAAFPQEMHRAAAVITYLTPGLRFVHQGQLEGRRKRISPHLVRAPDEPVDATLAPFYERLLSVLKLAAVRNGSFRTADCDAAWDGNGSADAFVAFSWEEPGGERLLVAANYAPHHSQCYVRLPFADLAGATWRLDDLMSEARYDRSGDDLAARGLYLDLAPWQYHVFTIRDAAA